VNHLRRNQSGGIRVSGIVLERASLGQHAFHRFLSLERRRAERSGKSFLMMLVEGSQRPFEPSNARVISEKTLSALIPTTRETDIVGWYKEGTVAGVVFTEIAIDDLTSTTTAIMSRISKTLKTHLSPQQFNQVNLSFHLLPEELDHKSSPLSAVSVAIPEVASPSLVAGL
jgi:hypothetical protein